MVYSEHSAYQLMLLVGSYVLLNITNNKGSKFILKYKDFNHKGWRRKQESKFIYKYKDFNNKGAQGINLLDIN